MQRVIRLILRGPNRRVAEPRGVHQVREGATRLSPRHYANYCTSLLILVSRVQPDPGVVGSCL